MHFVCDKNVVHGLEKAVKEQEELELFGATFLITGISVSATFKDHYYVDLQIQQVYKPKPKSERQIILEQSVKYHTQQIEHHELMRKKFEEELKNEGC